MRAYLDIETTFSGSISVIGIYRHDLGTIQLVGDGVRDLPLYEALEGVETLVTFNGTCFDLPVIRKRLYADLKRDFAHCDLLYYCRRNGLRGGLRRSRSCWGSGGPPPALPAGMRRASGSAMRLPATSAPC
jgi:uncharacterized protein YprB with RNaseH-like and TPR domain